MESARPAVWEDKVEVGLMAAIGYVAFCFYGVVSSLASRRGIDLGAHLHTRLDDAIPYAPVFIIPYVLAYVLPVLAIALVYRKCGLASLRRMFFAYLGLLLFHFAFYLALPTSATELMVPDAVLNKDAFASSIKFVYHLATAFNAFPSFHVASGWFISRLVARWEPRAAKAYYVWFWAMFAGTMAIKIHWFADAMTGWVMGEVWYRWVLTPMETRSALEWPVSGARPRLAGYSAALLLSSMTLGFAMLRLGL